MGSGKDSIAFSALDQAAGHEAAWENVKPLFDATRGFSKPSFVYFVGEEGEGPIKIGVAKNPIERLRQMQIGNPRSLCVEQIVWGDRVAEKLFHEYWDHLRIRSKRNKGNPVRPAGTEWFEAEIRTKLFPVVAEIAEAQVCQLEEPGGLESLGLIQDAHKLHGFKRPLRETIRVLGAGSGYKESRLR